MRLKAIALWPILVFLPIVYAHAQETGHVGADQQAACARQSLRTAHCIGGATLQRRSASVVDHRVFRITV